jgi:hypothetical protein
MKKNRRKKKITSIVTKWLILAVSVACVLSLGFTYLFLYERTQNDVYDLLEQNTHDLVNDVFRKTDEEIMRNWVGEYRAMISTADLIEPEKAIDYFEDQADENIELTVINEEGKITASSERSLCGENVLKNDSERFKVAAGMLNDYLKGKKDTPNIATAIIKYYTDKLSLALDGKRKLYFH